MKKLYQVNVVYTGMVLAENEKEAESFMSEIIRYDEPEATAEEFDGTLPWGWDDTCLTYNNEDKDILIAEAIKIHGQ